MSYESPDINAPLFVPNPEFFRDMGSILFPQVVIGTADNGDIEEQIRVAMRVEFALAAFCRGELTPDEFFELSEIYLGNDQIDEYIEEVADALEQEFSGLIL